MLTGGRSRAEPAIGHTAWVLTRSADTPTMPPEHAAILRLCQVPMTVADISTHLGLPASVVTVLVGDLLRGGLVTVRSALPAVRPQGRAVLQAVLRGLENL